MSALNAVGCNPWSPIIGAQQEQSARNAHNVDSQGNAFAASGSRANWCAAKLFGAVVQERREIAGATYHLLNVSKRSEAQAEVGKQAVT